MEIEPPFRWTQHVSAAVQVIVLLSAGVVAWYSFISSSKDHESEQDARLSLIVAQLQTTAEWRLEIRNNLKAMNDSLVAIQIGLVGKADRRP